MTIVTIGNEGRRDVDLRFDFCSASYGLRVPALDEIRLELPAEAVAAMLAQNDDKNIIYSSNGHRPRGGLWIELKD